MKNLTMLITLLAFSIMAAAPLPADAARKKAKSEVVMKMGSKVHLFHSSKVEVQKEIAIGDVLTVYRQLGGKTPQPKEVGEVKVLSFIGPHYFEAEITKGEIKIGDIAKKEDTSLLVQPAK
ncbi:MAG: hypothetical protein A2075_00245 [Geobacteraceae bacterium GWC2_58_44]|nr:MAG: hypothetical protein A2075_00245 [Geobacteraceae bacterium GWC2_58_44]HBG06381.1 hypothetical protein [Geobacter sp.]